jgi:hypothetical protein
MAARSFSSLSHLPRLHLSPNSRLLALRTQSNQSFKPPHHHDSTDSPSSSDPLLRKLEDAIHRIIVRRSAPDWLPFLPGSSYWVPPPPHGLNHLVHHFAKQHDESLAPISTTNAATANSISTVASQRGWPSSSYFINGLLLSLFASQILSVSHTSIRILI